MQFLLFDFALAFVALLGYRALETVVRRAPVLAVAARPQLNPLIVRRRPLPAQSVPARNGAPTCPPQECERRAPQHRLINFW